MADFELVPRVAVIEAEVLAVTAVVVTGKVATFVPAGTVTFAGTTAWALLDARVTRDPPAGAFAERVTVPVDPAPPATEAGDSATELTFWASACGAGRSAAPRTPAAARRGALHARARRRTSRAVGRSAVGRLVSRIGGAPCRKGVVPRSPARRRTYRVFGMRAAASECEERESTGRSPESSSRRLIQAV
ncbi:MAG: hypothetical protein DYH06_22815 [Acidobacteria bacterium ACB2]|nr:hypothetical protein [Acidobacteria bacterium ACB2]